MGHERQLQVAFSRRSTHVEHDRRPYVATRSRERCAGFVVNLQPGQGAIEMTIMRKITSLAAAAAVATGTLLPLAATAEAGSRHGKHYGHSHGAKIYGGHRSHRSYVYSNYDHHHGYVYRKKRRSHVGPAIALGIGALMLGIVASEHHHRHRY